MKEIGLIFLILCYMVFFSGCTINPEKNASSGSTVQNTYETNTYETNTEEYTDGNFNTSNCILDDGGNLLVMCENGYEPYTYDKFLDISRNLTSIIQVLCEGDNIVSLDWYDKLCLYYGLEENKCQLVGGNGVDIFNFSIDREQDSIEFSAENLEFPGLLDDDYRPQLLETFNLLFRESGGDIYRYLMGFYERPTDGVTDETLINGMQVTYKCTPKHKLVISLAGCSNTEINNDQQSAVSNSELINNTLSNNVSSSRSDEAMETLKSDDNKTIITVYTYTKRGNDNRSIEKIVVNDGDDSFEINDIIGYYGNMRWALGQSKAVIEYYGRQWRDFIIIDTKNKEVLYERSFNFEQLMDYFKKQGAVFNFIVNENRPDIEYRLNEMIDENNIRVDYVVHDENYVTQSGSFNYNLPKGVFSELIQNEPIVEG